MTFHIGKLKAFGKFNFYNLKKIFYVIIDIIPLHLNNISIYINIQILIDCLIDSFLI